MQMLFTKHARIRMLQREITEEEIESLIKNPEAIRKGFKERMLVRKRLSKGTLEVVYKESKKRTIVITCYWTKEG